jgi:2,4-dienoyl-CoA reductase-like NADH-dependent reductase (Old Yellow Enzyme family)
MPLFEPMSLPSGAALKNRIVKSAMSECMATSDGGPSGGLVRMYQRWADGGTSLLITGNVMVDPSAIGEQGNVIVEDERHLEGLKGWARAASGNDTQVWMQINHPGRQSPRHVSPSPVAPSAVAVKMGGAFALPRALEHHEILALIERFATTASVAQKAGFHGVQIHAAHGYLVSQFLSPLTNLRADQWGGDLANRMRFLIEIVRAVRSRVGPTFSVGVKLNSADFQRGGFDTGESIRVAQALEAEGIDMLEISGGSYEATAMWGSASESTRKREAYFLEYAEQIRQHVALPLLVTGGFRSLNGMEDALASGAVDFVGLARPLAVEPDLPARFAAGTADHALEIGLRTGIKTLDTVALSAWYGRQLNRMGHGQSPNPNLWRVAAVFSYLTDRRQWLPQQALDGGQPGL